MPPDPDTQPISVADAAELLGRAPGTIYSWATRYNAQRAGHDKGRAYFDLRDLTLIEWLIREGIPIPPTPAERARIHADTLALARS
ncbi:hypothetical protein [Acrocarpospora sp. B8E8]|uniref:terminase gpP N-terminus-related DNA-binding protein n=1 Tax=Acrocarpospora sp. B8E8 TaxID=3153572 RepID=UPI00325C8890